MERLRLYKSSNGIDWTAINGRQCLPALLRVHWLGDQCLHENGPVRVTVHTVVSCTPPPPPPPPLLDHSTSFLSANAPAPIPQPPASRPVYLLSGWTAPSSPHLDHAAYTRTIGSINQSSDRDSPYLLPHLLHLRYGAHLHEHAKMEQFSRHVSFHRASPFAQPNICRLSAVRSRVTRSATVRRTIPCTLLTV